MLNLWRRRELERALEQCREIQFSLQEKKDELDKYNTVQPRDRYELEQDEDGHYMIVCPYCLNKFKIKDLQFRATVVPDFSGAILDSFGLEEDQAYGDYWEKVSGSRGEDTRAHILQMDPAQGEIARITFKIDQYGHRKEVPYNSETRKKMCQYQTINVTDKYKHTSSVRICPHCHTELPNDIGFVPNYIFTLMGNSSCGKTVYLSRLILSLCNGNFLNNQFNGVIVNDESNNLEDSTQRRAERIFSPGGTMADATRVGYIRPVIVSLQDLHHRKLYITLFDYPGEGIWRMDVPFFHDIARRNLDNSNGWIFMFDPGTLPQIHNNLREEYRQVPDIEANNEQTASPAVIMNQVYNQYCYGAEIDKPVAFVLSKLDLIMQCSDSLQGVALSEAPKFFTQPGPHDRPDLVDAYLCDREIRRFLNGVGCNVVNQTDLYTNNNDVWFACSSTTVSPEDGVIPESTIVGGIRDTCPLEWMLYRCGVIPCADYSGYAEKAAVDDWAKIFQMGSDQFYRLKQDIAGLETQLKQKKDQIRKDFGEDALRRL